MSQILFVMIHNVYRQSSVVSRFATLIFFIFIGLMIQPDVGWSQQTCNTCQSEVENSTLMVDISQNPFNGRGENSFWYDLVPGWQAAFNTPHSIQYDPMATPVLCDYTYNYADGSEITCMATKGNGYSEGIYTNSKIEFDPDGYETYCVRMKVKNLLCFSDMFPFVVDVRLAGGIIYALDNSIVYNLPYANEIIHSELMDDYDSHEINITFNTINGNNIYDQLLINTRVIDPIGSEGYKATYTNVDSVHISCSTHALDAIYHTQMQENFKYKFSYHYPMEAKGIKEIIWDFGDGNTSNENNPEHLYNSAGIYQVCVDYITENYCCGSWCDTIHVGCNEFEADFTVNNFCPDYKFIPYENSNDLEYQWTVDDTIVSNDKIYLNTFRKDGSYTVSLKVKNNCGEEKVITKNIQVDCNRVPCDQNNGCINIGTQGDTVKLSQLVNGTNPLIPSTTQFFAYLISNQCFNLEGTLIIDLATVTFSNTTWYCGPGSKIVCNDYGLLNTISFIDSELSGCSAMWAGIEAKGNGKPNYYYFTSSIGFNNTTVSDAYHAVEISSGRSITAIDSRFYNNYIGIYITPTSTHNQIFTTIKNTTFEYTGSMLPAYIGQPAWTQRSYAGIEANDMVRVYVDGDETNSRSVFRNLSYGIKTGRSGVDVHNTTFERTDYNNLITPNDIYNHYGIYECQANSYSMISGNTFRGTLFHGIRSDSGSFNGIKITDNKFNLGDNTVEKDCYGIYISNSNNVSIEIGEYNTFDLKARSTGVKVLYCNYNLLKMDRNTFFNNKMGNGEIVYFGTCTPMAGVGLVRENIFEGVNMDGDMYINNSPKMVVLNNESRQKGIRMLQSNSPFGFFKNNSSEVTATKGAFIRSDISPDSKYCCNSAYAPRQWTFIFYYGGDMNHKLVSNQIRGLQLRHNAIIGVQPSYGNVFAQGSTAEAVDYTGGLTYFQRNQFNVDLNQMGHTPTTVIPSWSKTTWFLEDGGSHSCGSYDICDSEGFELPLIGEDTSWYYLQTEMPEGEAMDLVFNYAGSASLFANPLWPYRDLYIWNQTVRLYRHIQQNPNLNWTQLLNTTAVSSYYPMTLTPAMAQWAEVERARESLYQMSYQESKMLRDNQKIIATKYRQLRTASDDLSILNLYQELYAAHARIDSLGALVASRTDVAIAEVAQDIDALSTIFPFLAERKTVWQADMKRMQYGIEAVTSAEWEEIARIAALCPQAYGSAVYEAIGLLTLHEGTLDALALLNEDCTSSLEERSNKSKLGNRAVAYPNPTTGILYIDHAGMTADRIIITDMLGQVRYETVLEGKVVQTMIDLSHLPAGIYQYSILNGSVVQGKGKVIRIN